MDIFMTKIRKYAMGRLGSVLWLYSQLYALVVLLFVPPDLNVHAVMGN